MNLALGIAIWCAFIGGSLHGGHVHPDFPGV